MGEVYLEKGRHGLNRAKMPGPTGTRHARSSAVDLFESREWGFRHAPAVFRDRSQHNELRDEAADE